MSFNIKRGWIVRFAAASLLLLAMASPSVAAVRHEQHVVREGNGWMQENTGPLGGEKSLQVLHFIGNVQVITGASSASYVLRLHSAEADERDARREFSTFHLGIGHARGVDVMQPVGPVDLALRAELILQIPAKTEDVHVDSMGGTISIRGKVHRLDVQVHGGDIEIDEADQLRAVTVGGSVIVNHRLGDSFIRTEGGDIRVDASVGDLEIASLGGNIWLKAIANGRVQSGGGNIEVVRCAGALVIRTAGGNINLGEMGGQVTAETGGGGIRIGVARGMVAVSTALGDIELWKLSQGAIAHSGMGSITAEFVGGPGAMRNSELVTSMGNIVVYFAAGVPANVHAVVGASPSRRIISDFADVRFTNGLPQYGPRSIFAEGAIHGGGPDLFLRTMIGQIELRNAH
jgi:hypothetical protein